MWIEPGCRGNYPVDSVPQLIRSIIATCRFLTARWTKGWAASTSWGKRPRLKLFRIEGTSCTVQLCDLARYSPYRTELQERSAPQILSFSIAGSADPSSQSSRSHSSCAIGTYSPRVFISRRAAYVMMGGELRVSRSTALTSDAPSAAVTRRFRPVHVYKVFSKNHVTRRVALRATSKLLGTPRVSGHRHRSVGALRYWGA